MSPAAGDDRAHLELGGPILWVFERYRWVGQYAIKCDLRSAMRAREHIGGRVERATATLLADGTEILSRWDVLIPALEDTAERADTGLPADPQDVPTGGHTHG